MRTLRAVAVIASFLWGASVGVAQSNGTVTFGRKGEKDCGAGEAKTTLTVKKGTHELAKTDANASHKFPPYTNWKAMADYYGPILNQAGFTENTDYKITDGSIHFYGVVKLDGGTAGGVDLTGTLDKGKFETLSDVKLAMDRGADPQFGLVTLTGSALVFSGSAGELADTRSSQVTAYFAAADTSQTMMATIASALQTAGWTVTVNDNAVVISALPGGVPVYSLNVMFEYLPKLVDGDLPPPTDADDDHWTLERLH